MKTILKKKDSVAHIIINRPEKLNALDQATIAQLIDRFEECEKDKKIQVIILTSTGEKAFCAGGDVKEVYFSSLEKGQYQKEYLEREFKLNKILMDSSKIIISHIKGIAMGGGIALPIGGDFVLADETTIFALPEIDLAMIPDVGLGYYVSKLSQSKALYLTLLGRSLKSYNIMDFGFATHYIQNSSWHSIVQEIESLSLKGKEKDTIRFEIENILKKYVQDHQPSDYEKNKNFYLKHFEQESLEGIFSSLSTDPSSQAKKTLNELKSKCPIASQLIFYKYFIGKNWSRQETFFHDSRILEYCYNYGNMKEGIRSVMIDKDQAKFSPNKIEDVDIQKIKEVIIG